MHIDAITTNPAALKAAVDKPLKDRKLKTWRKLLNAEAETLTVLSTFLDRVALNYRFLLARTTKNALDLSSLNRRAKSI